MTPQVMLRLHSLCRSVRVPPPERVARVFHDERAPVPASDSELWTFVAAAFPPPDVAPLAGAVAELVCDALPVARGERDRAREMAAILVAEHLADWWSELQLRQWRLLRELHPRPAGRGAHGES